MKKLTLTITFALVLLTHAASFAQEAKKDAEGFEPVKAGDMMTAGETLPATNLVAAAYAFIWGSVLVYVFMIARTQKRLEADLAALKQRVEK